MNNLNVFTNSNIGLQEFVLVKNLEWLEFGIKTCSSFHDSQRPGWTEVIRLPNNEFIRILNGKEQCKYLGIVEALKWKKWKK